MLYLDFPPYLLAISFNRMFTLDKNPIYGHVRQILLQADVFLILLVVLWKRYFLSLSALCAIP